MYRMNSEISNIIDMNERDLEKLNKVELMKMVEKLQKKAKKPKIVTVDDDYRQVTPPGIYKPSPAPSANETIKKPIPKPSKGAKQMVNEYEDLIVPPPPQLRDGYKPIPVQEPVPAPKIAKLTPKITKLDQALKGYVASFEVGLVNYMDPIIQLQQTRRAIEFRFEASLEKMREFKFNEALKVTFKKQLGDITTHRTAYFSSKAKTITNVNESHQELKTSQEEILYVIATWLSEGSCWVVDKVNNHCCAMEEHSHHVSFLLLFFFLGLQISICFGSDVLSCDLLLFNT